MKKTNIRIFKANQNGKVLAYANYIIDGMFIIRGIKLIETEKSGRFLAMPSRQIKNGEKRTYRDVCHPLDSKVRKELTEKIFAAYDEFIKNEE